MSDPIDPFIWLPGCPRNLPEHYTCPDCGPHVAVDEDELCVYCGAWCWIQACGSVLPAPIISIGRPLTMVEHRRWDEDDSGEPPHVVVHRVRQPEGEHIQRTWA